MVSASSCFLYRVYRVKRDRNIQLLIQHYYLCFFFIFLLHGTIRTIGTLLVLLKNCSCWG